MVSMQLAFAIITFTAAGGDVELLEFSAPWCGPCRQMQSTVDSLKAAGYPIRQLDFDTNKDQAAKLHVDRIPTFVLVVNGQEVDRIVGPADGQELAALFQRAGHVPGKGNQSSEMEVRGQSPEPPRRIFSGLNRVLGRAPGTGPLASLLPRRNAAPATDPFAGQAPTWQPDLTANSVESSEAPAAPAAQFNAPPAATPMPAGANALATPAAGSVGEQELISSVVRLIIEDAKGSSYGSGVIVDSRDGDALVLTCGHVFRDSQGKGKVAIDLFGPGAPKKLPGKVISYDITRDVGLVSIHPGTGVRVAPVAPAGVTLIKGDAVFTAGCDHGQDATIRRSQVTGVNKFLGSANVEIAGEPVQGRSGGPLFNMAGQVVGVCNAADTTEHEGLYAALDTIHLQLDSARLATIYRRGAQALTATSAITSEVNSAGFNAPLTSVAGPAFSTASRPDVEPAQWQAPANASLSAPLMSATSGVPRPASDDLSAGEKATLSQLRKKSENAEVICIVRSLSDPAARSEIIVLDRASPAFLKQLASERTVQDGRQLTSFDIPRRPAATVRQSTQYRP